MHRIFVCVLSHVGLQNISVLSPDTRFTLFHIRHSLLLYDGMYARNVSRYFDLSYKQNETLYWGPSWKFDTLKKFMEMRSRELRLTVSSEIISSQFVCIVVVGVWVSSVDWNKSVFYFNIGTPRKISYMQGKNMWVKPNGNNWMG